LATKQIASPQNVPHQLWEQLRNILRMKETGVLMALLVMGFAITSVAPVFATPNNLLNIGRQVSMIGMMAVAMTFILVTGEVDLSIGSTYAIVPVIAGLLMLNGVHVWIAVFIGLLLGAGIGFCNGFLSTYGRLPSFIATLGTMSILRGLALVISGAYPVVISGGAISGPGADLFFFLGGGKLFGVIPMQLVFFIAVLIIGAVILGLTAYGFRVYAIGGNARAAHLSGVHVQRVKIMNFTAMGFMAGVAGLLTLAFLGTVTATIGIGYELDVIAAVIIGGTPLGGGGGTILGTLIGALIMAVLRNGLVLLNVSPFWQTVTIGFVIILAVGLERWVVRRKA
jgi:ribose transport system permease protein